MYQKYFAIIQTLLIAAFSMGFSLAAFAQNSRGTNTEKTQSQEKQKSAAEKPLEGHVQQSGDGSAHLSRPSLPPTKATTKSTQTTKPLNAVKSFNFDIAPKSLEGKTESNSSLFEQSNGQNDVEDTPSRNQPIAGSIAAVDLPMQEELGDQIINWDRWHKRFVESLYVIFHRANNGSAPGASRVLVRVSRNGDLDFQAGDDFAQQSTAFQKILSRSFKMLSHDPSLEFPEGSQRTQVEFTMNLRSLAESGKSSYGFTTGDREKTPKP